jgi:hypothetical protein
MPQKCTVCSHPESFAINEAIIVEGLSNRAIASQFGLDKSSMQRHKKHVPELLLSAWQHFEAAGKESLVDRLEEITRETRAVLRESRDGDDPDNHLALRAIARLEKQIELEAEILEVIRRQPIVNVLIAPALEGALIRALEPHPEAHGAVAEVIREIRSGSPGGAPDAIAG